MEGKKREQKLMDKFCKYPTKQSFESLVIVSKSDSKEMA